MSISSGLTTDDSPVSLFGSPSPSGTVAAASGGGAFWTAGNPHGISGAAWLGYGIDTSGNVTQATPPADTGFTTVTTLGSTPFWGDCAFPPAAGNISCSGASSTGLLSGFPTPSTVHSTPGWVTSLTPVGTSVDFVLNDRYPGFYSFGSVSVCNGLTAPFPADSQIIDMAYGAAGEWFADAGRHSIWQATGICTVSEHAVPDGTAPRHITEGVDGRIYFTTASGIWSASGNGLGFAQFVDPGLVDPQGVTSGSDGNIWFTDTAGHQIGKLDIHPNLGIGALHFNPTVLKSISKGTIGLAAPGGITGLSSTNPDFQVASPNDLQAPPNLNVDCPSTCYVGVTFTPSRGSPIHDETGQLLVTLATGEVQAYPLTGSVLPPGQGQGWENNH